MTVLHKPQIELLKQPSKQRRIVLVQIDMVHLELLCRLRDGRVLDSDSKHLGVATKQNSAPPKMK